MIDFRKIPFTYLWLIDRAIGQGVMSVLDLGAGQGEFMKTVSSGKKWKITGIEIYPKAIKIAKKQKVYREIIKGSIVDIPKKLQNKKFDLVFSSQVLEHLTKSDGIKSIKKWESMSRNKIVITTTIGFIDYDPIESKSADVNPYQKHKSGWSPIFFKEKGYTVRGQGWKFLYGKNGLAKLVPIRLFFVVSLVGYLVSPIVYFFPNFGIVMVCSKKIT